MILHELTTHGAEDVRQWRNLDIAPNRTPFLLTEENQKEWYKEVTKRDSDSRIWEFIGETARIAVGGLTGIHPVNRTAEIALVVNPKFRRKGNGMVIVNIILSQAFKRLNINTVFGEVYYCANVDFWLKTKPHYTTTLPNRKYWDGVYHDSMYFSWSKSC